MKNRSKIGFVRSLALDFYAKKKTRVKISRLVLSVSYLS